MPKKFHTGYVYQCLHNSNLVIMGFKICLSSFFNSQKNKISPSIYMLTNELLLTRVQKNLRHQRGILGAKSQTSLKRNVPGSKEQEKKTVLAG